MSDTINAIARALSADVQALGAISHNVANINTPGYRGVRTVAEFGGDTLTRSTIDQRDGGIMLTERALDVALQGPGFFVVERDGQPLLARAGALHVDIEGRLVTAQGDLVRGLDAAIGSNEDVLRLDANGELWAGQDSLGRLELVDVADAGGLHPAGGGAYRYSGDLREWSGRLVQGALETANVDPADETIRLMETTRHAESVQRAISIYDKAMDVGINRLGDN